MIKWLTDENVPRQIIRLLREKGFDVADVRGLGLSGAADSDVMAAAQRETRVLVTTDMGFSNIIHYPPESHNGIVVLRLNKPSGTGFAALFQSLVDSFDLDSLPGTITIVSENRVRQRKRLSS